MLDKLPSVLTQHEFNDKGLAKTAGGLLVPAYIGSQLGFSTPGRFFLTHEFYPKLRLNCGVLPLCPFAACSEYLDFSKLNDEMPVKEMIKFWEDFNRVVGEVNYETLMPRAKFMIAVLDGSHAVDDGLASEIAYFTARHGPVIGIRSDFRLSENPAAPINPAVRYFMDNIRGGKFWQAWFLQGPDAYDKAYRTIKELANTHGGKSD